MELKHDGKRIIAAVGQRPFTYGANTFCKLIPLFDHLNETEKILNPLDFYNDGEIWWRLSSNTNPDSIIPGMLMETTLEPSQEKSDDPGKSLYQARFTSKEDALEQSAGAELFRPFRETARTIMRLKGRKNGVRLPHISAKQVFLAVDGCVYGPFAAREAPTAHTDPGWDYALTAIESRGGMPKLYKIAETEFNSRYAVLREEITVSLDEKGKGSSHKTKVAYEYLPPDVCARMREEFGSAWEELDWEPLSAKFSRMMAAVKSFSRNERQQLKDLVKRLEESSEASGFAEELKAAASGVRKLDEESELAFKELGAAMLNCDLMDEARYTKVKNAAIADWIAGSKEAIEEDIKDLKQEREDLDKKNADLAEQIKRERERRKEQQKQDEQRVKSQLDKMREKANRELADERRAWEERKAKDTAALEERRKHIDAALEEIKARSEKNVSDCMAMFPFLKEMVASMRPAAPAIQEPVERRRGPRPEPFEPPRNIYAPSPAAKNAATQEAFLARLADYARQSGLSYDANDLRRFHLSVLCEGLTVLEGPAGVGKSSLARIYGDVLAGAGAEYPREGTHIVHVSPSWMERADLLGYVNAVTAEFSPSETGLYQRLLLAEADYAKNGSASALYPVCLDEMNLAQVEHYFSDFMQIMEMPEEKRVLPCFSKDAVSGDAVFREHSSVKLAPSVRFVGTVNFDETTRRLSARLLDRANLVYLGDGSRMSAHARLGGADAGPGVAYGTFTSWRRTAALSANVEKTLAALAEPLRTLGVAVSPRVRSGMARYIASAAPLLGAKAEAIALDEQIAQRVISKVRSITSVAQKKALGAVADIVDSFRDDAYSPSRAAIERLRAKEHFFGYESES